MKKSILAFLLALTVVVTFVPSVLAQREVAKGDGYSITEQPGQNGSVVVTCHVIGAFAQKEDFDRVTAMMMAKVKELYGGRYTLRKENQRVYSSGTANQPSGDPLQDTKDYILLPKAPSRIGGPNGPYGPRNSHRNGPPNRYMNGNR